MLLAILVIITIIEEITMIDQNATINAKICGLEWNNLHYKHLTVVKTAICMKTQQSESCEEGYQIHINQGKRNLFLVKTLVKF